MKKTIAIVGGGMFGKTAAMALENKGIDVIVVDEPKPHNSFEVNGELFVPIEEHKPSRGFSKLAAIASMAAMFTPDLGYSKYDRELPKGTDIITEYGLIQQKKSKLSKWEREQVVFKFNKHFKKL